LLGALEQNPGTKLNITDFPNGNHTFNKLGLSFPTVIDIVNNATQDSMTTNGTVIPLWTIYALSIWTFNTILQVLFSLPQSISPCNTFVCRVSKQSRNHHPFSMKKLMSFYGEMCRKQQSRISMISLIFTMAFLGHAGFQLNGFMVQRYVMLHLVIEDRTFM
jgi:hypothetical protein